MWKFNLFMFSLILTMTFCNNGEAQKFTKTQPILPEQQIAITGFSFEPQKELQGIGNKGGIFVMNLLNFSKGLGAFGTGRVAALICQESYKTKEVIPKIFGPGAFSIATTDYYFESREKCRKAMNLVINNTQQGLVTVFHVSNEHAAGALRVINVETRPAKPGENNPQVLSESYTAKIPPAYWSAESKNIKALEMEAK